MTGATQTPTAKNAERGIKSAILAVFVEGVRRRNPGAVVNAVLAFAVTHLPGVVERRFGVELRQWQRLYTETAVLGHAVGMLGLYDDTWWWDHVTHVLSATILGGFVHAGADRRGRDPERWVLAAIVGGGSLWEAAEYTIHRLSDRLGVEPVLVYYGPRDTIKDLLFNLLGALLVLAFGDRLLRNVTGDAG